jgi:GPH family glycoside/pentoside/hexuronide:cation symporter
MIFWVMVQVLIFTIPPHDIPYLLTIAALAGVGVSAAYVLPDSLFADIIEWDELLTRRRQEGIYFGARAFIRKLTGAFVIFITLQTLGWTGYQTPPEDITTFTQSASALLMIRLLVSPIGATILLGAVIFAWLFPLTREKYARIQRLLERRKEKRLSQ